MLPYQTNPKDEPIERRWIIATAILAIPTTIAILHSIYKILTLFYR